MSGDIDELLVALGFELDDDDKKALKEFNESLASAKKLIKKVATAALAASAAITGLVVTTTSATDAQRKLAEQIGTTVGVIDAFQFANKEAGGTVEGMSSSLKTLSKTSAEAFRGVGGGIEAFGMLGVSVTDLNGNIKGTPSLLIEVSEAMQGLQNGQQIDLAEKLGLGGSIDLLREGPDAIREYVAAAEVLGTTTEKDAASARKFQSSLNSIWQIVKQVSRVLTAALVPMLQETNDKMIDWWKTNRSLIEQKIPEWLDSVAKAAKFLAIGFGVLISIQTINGFITILSVIKKMNIALALTNGLAFLIPTLIVALAAAFALLVMDIKGFMNGQESFIGTMLEKYPKLAEAMGTLGDVFSYIGEITGLIVDGWKEIINLLNSDVSLFDYFDELPEFISATLGVKSEADEPYNAFAGAEFAPLLANPLPPSNVSNSSKSLSVDKVNITVSGAGNPAKVASAVEETFLQALNDLNTPLVI